MPIVKNKYRDTILAEDVNIMRPSRWGNPFVIGKDGTREQVIEKYEQWIRNRPSLVQLAKQELKGCDLVCCCKPKACHGDVLLQIANES